MENRHFTLESMARERCNLQSFYERRAGRATCRIMGTWLCGLQFTCQS